MSDLSVAADLAGAPPAPSAGTPPAPTPPDGGAPAAPPSPTPPAPPADDALKLPGKDAKPEDWKAFYSKLGAPESAEGYKLEVPDGHDPAFAKAAAGLFAEIGLMPQQAERLNKWWNEQSAAALASAEKREADAVIAQQAKAKADDDALKNEFQGEAYTKLKETAGKAVREFFPGTKEEQTAALSALEGVLGYGGLYRFLNKIGSGLAEGTLRGADNGAPPPPKPLANLMFDEVLAKAGLIKPAK